MLRIILSLLAYFALWTVADMLIGPLYFNTVLFWFIFVLFTALISAIDYAHSSNRR